MFRSNYWLLIAPLLALVSIGTLVGFADDDDGLWQTNFEQAKAQAQSENKLLLVDFTGSDWCGWCIRLKQEVFDQEVFKKEAPQQFVFVELDFPRQKQLPEELKTQNEQLRERFRITGFPTILVLDAQGEMIARTGYRPGGPEKYVEHLKEFVSAHETIVKMRSEVANVQGLDRAKLLDQLIDAYAKLGAEPDDVKAWTAEIISLDADNQAGLKLKYEFRQLMSEADALKRGRKFAEAKDVYAKALELPGISGELKQDAYFATGECLFYAKDFPGVVASLKQAIEAAPDSSKVANIQAMIQRFEPTAEAQLAVASLQGQLDGSQGLDRARLLDQLLDARSTLSRMVPDPQLARDTEVWSREIVDLDAENAAGLKAKYGPRVLLADAQQLVREQKFDEAHAVLAKALAMPDVAGEPLLELHLAQANAFAAQEKFEQSVDACQKALAAAPTSRRAGSVQAVMRRTQAELDKRKAKEQPQPEAAAPKSPG